MSEPVAFLNGRFLPQSAAVLPVYDAGFVLGVTVAEQMRTFNGKLFRLEEHLRRLGHGLAIVGVELGMSLDQLASVAREVVNRNHCLLAEGDDLALVIFVTPGAMSNMAPAVPAGPTICAHSYALPFHLWHEKYAAGERLVTTEVRQTPTNCWPADLKCRSRMHYYLADRAARRIDPQARALMLDERGSITEATTANFVIYRKDEGIVAPPRDSILPGVTLGALREIAAEASIAWHDRELTPGDVFAADEAWLVSTSPCLLPVASFNGRPIGAGAPGPLVRSLLNRWNRIAQLDIVEQAARFSRRGA